MSSTTHGYITTTAAAAKLKGMEEIYTEQISTLRAERDELFRRLQEYENSSNSRVSKTGSLSPSTTPPPPSLSPRHQFKKEPGVSLKPLTKGQIDTTTTSLSTSTTTAAAALSSSAAATPSTAIIGGTNANTGVIAAMRVRIANLEQIVKEKEDSKNNEIKALKAALADSEKMLEETRREVTTLTGTLEKERASNERAAILSAKQISDLKAELERARHRYRELEAEKRAMAIERGISSGSSQDTLQRLIEMVPSEEEDGSTTDLNSENEPTQIINKLKRALLNSRKEACYLYARVAALHQQALAHNSLLCDSDIGDDDGTGSGSGGGGGSNGNGNGCSGNGNEGEDESAHLSTSTLLSCGCGGSQNDVVAQAEYLYLNQTVKILREELNSMCEVLSKERDVIADALSYNKFDIDGITAAVANVTNTEDESRGSGREPFNILGKFIKTFSTVVGKLLKKFKDQHDLFVRILKEEPVSRGMIKEIKIMTSPAMPDVDENGNPVLNDGEALITPGAIRSSLISVTSYAQSAAASEEETLRKK